MLEMYNAWYYPNKYLHKLKCDIWYYIESLPLSRNLEQVMDIGFFSTQTIQNLSKH